MVQRELAGAAETQAQSGREVYPDNRFFHLFMACVSTVLLTIAAICLVFLHYRLQAPSFNDYAGLVALIVATWYCWWAKFERFFQACLIIAWSYLTERLLAYPVYLAARCKLPLQDQALAQFDRAMGVQVPAILNLMAQHPAAKTFFAVSYDLLFPMMVLGVMLPAVMYRWTAVKELIVGTSVATIVGSAMFALCPAIGPWVVYHYPPSMQQQTCAALFLNLRTNSFHILGPSDKGIVCFPSFHVLLAILSCIALYSIKPLRIPAIAIAVCIVISTLTTGWHYVTDVIGGLTLAVFSVLSAKWYTRLEARFSSY
jgi:membrane-associated phospholipid phosphatase